MSPCHLCTTVMLARVRRGGDGSLQGQTVDEEVVSLIGLATLEDMNGGEIEKEKERTKERKQEREREGKKGRKRESATRT